MRYILFLLGFALFSCQSQTDLKEQNKKEILEAERAFAQMAREVSIPEPFIAFADPSATIERNDILISGIDALKAHFSSPLSEGTSLDWTPDFVDASASGDLGYTYGKYVYTRLDSTGNPEEITGIFHTVWKKQPDGSWKYVWD
jgi:ketosteroid isomerase-like protein